MGLFIGFNFMLPRNQCSSEAQSSSNREPPNAHVHPLMQHASHQQGRCYQHWFLSHSSGRSPDVLPWDFLVVVIPIPP